MSMRNILIAAALASMILPVSAQTTRKLTANKSNEFGLIYTLPQTAIDVAVEAERTVRTRGEFYKYARKYLGIDPIMNDETVWTLKSVTINPRGTATTDNDTDDRYLVQFKNGTQPFLMLTEESIPLSINATEGPASPQKNTVPQPVKASPTPLDGPEARQAITEEMLQARSTAKRAELAAAKIYEIRQYRNDIVSGQADGMPSDGAAMKLALDNLSKQEAALTAMFIGTESKSTDVEMFTITPERPIAKGSAQEIIVARISATDGIVDPSDLSGAPIRMTLSAESLGELPVNEKGQPKAFPKGGLAYCIPGRALINIDYDGRKMAEDQLSIAQYGIVFGLDPGLFTDKKAPAYARFDPTTGAIVEMGTATSD